MEWSKKVGSVAGIPIRIHLTMLLVAAWLLLFGNETIDQRISELVNLSILFASVALHELGHALMAKYLGIRTRDIVLYPFGGVASLIDRINPKQELLITLAGPLVNVVIAVSMILTFGFDRIGQEDFFSSPLGTLFSANAALAIFNALPAFPMDGGRILRASLQLMGVRSATKFATRCSQAICIALAILAFIYSHPILFLVAVFVFYNASRELIISDVQVNSPTFNAAQVMIPLEQMQQLSPSTTLEVAAKFALRSLQSHFPVCIEARVLGIVDRDLLMQKACTNIEPQYITEVMLRDLPCCESTASLPELIKLFDLSQSSALLVGTQEQCLGIIFREQLNDLMLMHQMFRQNLAHRELERELGSS